MRRSLLALALLTIAASLHGQDVGPRAGSWGAETGHRGGAAILRFRSPSDAWVLGAATSQRRVPASSFVGFGGLGGLGVTSSVTTRSTIRLGYRWYRNVDETIRPFTTVSPLVVLTNVPGQRVGVGAALELGSTQFLHRNISVGAATELRAEYFPAGGGAHGLGARSFTLLARGARLLAAVYF